ARAVELIQGEPAREWTVADLAREVGMSRTLFTRRFRDVLGKPPMRYVAKARLGRAAGYLATTNSSVYEIAVLVGYDSDASLSKAFKREFGSLPASTGSAPQPPRCSPFATPFHSRAASHIAGPALAVGAPDQLADLDQVPVGIAHVAPDLGATVDRRGHKLRSAGAPELVDSADVGDADVQEARGVIWIRGRRERHGRLVVRGVFRGTDGDPAARPGPAGKLIP